MQRMATAMDRFLLDMGRYPTAEEGGAALIEPAGEDAKNWKGPYLDKKSAVIDPWGEPYRFRRPGREGPFDISAPGPTRRKAERATMPISSWTADRRQVRVRRGQLGFTLLELLTVLAVVSLVIAVRSEEHTS